MLFCGVRFIGCTVIILHRCSVLSGSMDVPLLYYIVVPVYRFIGRTVFVLRRCSKLFEFLVSRAYRFCTTPLHWLNFLLFLTFSTSFNYGNDFMFPVFILEPGDIVEIEVSPDLIYEQHSIRIIASEVERLRNKDVLLVKVQWFSDPKDCSWESWEFIERSRSGLLFHAL